MEASQVTSNLKKRNAIAIKHAKLVHRIVHRLIIKSKEPYEDLYQVGFLGLIKAVERFDEGLGNAFSSFAVPYIEGEIRHYLRDDAPALKLPRNAIEKHSQVKRLRKHFISLNRQIDESEVAEKIGISQAQWQFIEQVNSSNLNISLEELVHEPKTEEEVSDSIDVYSALSKLNSKQRYCVTSRYLLGKSIKDIAMKLKLSDAIVEAIITEAIYILNVNLSKNNV